MCRYGAPPIRRSRPAAVEFRGHGHCVCWLAATVEVKDRVVHALVIGPVEVTGPQPLEHVGDGVLAQQHSAEHGLFCGLVLRRLAPEVLGGRWDVVDSRMPAIVHDSHGGLTSPQRVEHTFDSRYRDCKPGPRRAQPPRRRNASRRPTLDVAGAVGNPPCL